MTDVNAGRELDAVVAEKVMGWKLLTVSRHRAAVLLKGLPPYAKGSSSRAAVPHYSTSIADAWRIVEKLLGIHYVGFDIRHHGTWTAVVSVRRTSFSADADTAQLAICRAAIAASEAT